MANSVLLIFYRENVVIFLCHFSLVLQVSRKVSEVVLDNHTSYSNELKRVTELQDSLADALQICKDGRTYVP